MPFTDPVISLKISSSGGTDFPKTPENAQSGRTAEVRAAQQKSGPRSRSPGHAAEVRAAQQKSGRPAQVSAQLNNQLNNQLYKNSASLFLTETEMR